MPSWPARLHLGSPSSSKPGPNPRSHGPRSPIAGQVLNQGLVEDPPLIGVPILAGNSAPGGNDIAKSRHGRSRSHPFPSDLSRSLEDAEIAEGSYSSNTGHHAFTDAAPTYVSRDYANASNGGPNSAGEKEMVTGKCATCDSLVRWPRRLDVFRCTVCLMINDLKPSMGAATAENPRGDDKNTRAGVPSNMKHNKVPSLSLQKTVALIDECIDVYLPSRTRNPHRLNQPMPAINSENAAASATLASSAPLPTSYLNPPVSTVSNSHIPSPSRAPPPPPPFTMVSPSTHGKAVELENDTGNTSKTIFRPLENYIISCFSGVDGLNSSFMTSKPPSLLRTASEGAATQCKPQLMSDEPIVPFPELDAKTLLIGDFAENGTWWAGKTHDGNPGTYKSTTRLPEETTNEKANAKSPRIDWKQLDEWYAAVCTAGNSWRDRLAQISDSSENKVEIDQATSQKIDEEIVEAGQHLQRTLLKASENLLRRPGKPLKRPEDCRFLLMILSNPLLYPSEYHRLKINFLANKRAVEENQDLDSSLKPPIDFGRGRLVTPRPVQRAVGSGSNKHSGIVKRVLGLISTLPSECHQYIVSWLSRFEESHFRRLVELVGSFVTHRLSRQHRRKRSNSHDPTGGLIPEISGPGAGTSAQLHAALGASIANKQTESVDAGAEYSSDWQVKAAAKTMSLLFSANNNDWPSFRPDGGSKPLSSGAGRLRANSTARKRTHPHGQLVPTNAFYNTLLDYCNLIADFEIWESRRGKFSFCQYPMFLSIWAKIRIMEHDAHRQMEIKAREAFFNSIMSRKVVNQFLVLKVRRDCLVEDSLRNVSEVVGTGQEEIKKGLRIDFVGEEGLDSGGLRKEWFLLLVREIFDPEHGLFVYDEESQYCYFNPHSFETSDQFFLVGVLLGLAIYNSTILDVALPPFAFRKLLASAPSYTGPATFSSRPMPSYSLEDLSEYRPSLVQGLRQLLSFEGDVESTFCQDFVAVVDRYGQPVTVPLCPNGEKRAVTNANRREFVDLYVRYLLDTSVSRQYEPFKRGFFTVCGGNALSLFRPEEIELLIRGSDEPLDVATLQSVAVYDNWGKDFDPAKEPIIEWFWQAFANATPKNQRKLLSFITASDRIPAMGAASLVIKIICHGDHADRFPTARTCFNMIALYRYPTRTKLEEKLWMAVEESEGFGIK